MAPIPHCIVRDIETNCRIYPQTRLVIDCLGIRVKMAELESWGEYERLRRKIHNGFTSTWLYELLFPRRYKRLYRAYIEARWKMLDEFLDRVLREE